MSRLPSGTTHSVEIKTRYECHMVEVEDLNFHHDSAVLLPDYGAARPQEGTTPDQERITGLAVLYACYRHAREHPDQSALVVGHTDRSGSEGYNQTLSELRASNVLHALRGERSAWVEVCRQKSKVEDYQQILIWLTHSLGWHCDPGGKTNVHDEQTHAAVRAFQEQYNADDRFPNDIGVDGQVGRQTWGAFFDVYMLELQHALGTDAEGLATAQQSLQFTACEAIGCGENFPITPDREENYESPVDRRVEVLFFDPGEEPAIDCGRPHGACEELYERQMYCVTPVPVTPLPLPSGTSVHVFLTLTYTDPEGHERAFPEGCPVTVEYGNGTSDERTIGSNGLLEFFALREGDSFTLRFFFREEDYPSGAYMASPQHDASGLERLLTGDAVRGHLGRFFLLPRAFGLDDAEWTVTGADTYDDATGTFERLSDTSVARIGSQASPATVVLDPRWQHFKLLYYDRWLKQKLSVPPLVVDGFIDRDSADPDAPDTRSNWVTPEEACQCLPWILSDTGTPDAQKLLQFRTHEQTYIESTGTSSSPSRRLVTKSSSPTVAEDVGLNYGDSVNTDFDAPNANRLAYYDLPPVWKSRTYFTRLSGGSGAPAARSGRFEDLAGEATTDAQPLLFSLDDIVLTDANGQPINWTPDAQPQNRVALFCNTFAQSGPSSADLSNVGLYKPDTANGQTYFTQRPSEETDRNYIADYPDWTRLVITQGNLFDVFDQRTPDSADGVVGARAGVRHLDVFASNSTFVPPGTDRPGLPPATRRPFLTIHPLYEQRHDAWWTSSKTDDRGIGRFDLALLRCCDVASDNVTEVAQCLSYFRFFFNQNATFTPSNNPNGTPLGLSGNAARNWSNTAIGNLLNRWNGHDAYNPGIPSIRPTGTEPKLTVQALWFAQDLPRALSHYELGVFQDTTTPSGVRAYMSAQRGEGALDRTDNVATGSGWFTFAHEVGHGGSLGDEYVEPTTPTSLPSPWLDGFDSFSPGSPFVIDDRAMMVSNRIVRPRFFWHVAEWLRDLHGGTVDFEVRHGTHTYALPHHTGAPGTTHVNFPLAQAYDQERGDHGRYDVFFYPLGREHFSVNTLPSRAGNPVAFDGLIVVLVKMEFDFDIDTAATIHTWLSAVDAQINLRFNYKYYAAGTFSGQTYNRCLIHVAPRYFADDYSSGDPRDDDAHIEVDVPDNGVPEWDSGLFADDHELHFPRNQPPHVFARYFAHMLGMADGTHNNPNSYTPIVRAVLPNATVSSI